MSQDSNPNLSKCSSLVIFMNWACERREVYFLRCDQRVRAANAQSFTLWQQAKIEITQRDSSIIACSRHTYLCVALCAHSVRGESHFQRNANWDFVTTSPPFCNEEHLSHVPFVKVAPGTICTSWSKYRIVVIGKSEEQVRKASQCSSNQH